MEILDKVVIDGIEYEFTPTNEELIREISGEEVGTVMKELNIVEVEVPNIKFTLDELDGLELSVEDMFALDAFIEE